MSALQRNGSGQGSSTFELGSKKKFGKNLNKLQKPPPPPINNGASKGSGSSRNGLLLLSTKRSTSIGSSQGSGLLSSKPTAASTNNGKTTATTQPLGIRNETYASTHDALVDAVMGASRNNPQKEPDAWGAAEKQAPPKDGSLELNALVEQAPTQEHHAKQLPVYNENDYDRGYQPNKNNLQQIGDRYEGYDVRRYSRNEGADDSRRSDADDNWRHSGDTNDEQAEYMARLAKERAERRREEEEARMHEQRERATKRLISLEQNMDGPAADSAPSTIEKHGIDPAVTLNGGRTRTLYDPSKPFSSLVGGSTPNGEKPTPEVSPEKPAPNRSSNVESPQPDGHVIHITNYEDRDRGERNGTAGPRMLFDPKSGSMVAVTEKNKNQKAKPKSRRDTDKAEVGEIPTNGKKKLVKGRNEPIKKDRRRGDSIEVCSGDESKVVKPRKARPAVNRLPRTCGVLYIRDEKGACYSADGCEGDQGYGCHGVPGGRIRNPSEFAKFQEEHQLAVEESESQEERGDEDDHQMLQGYNAHPIMPLQEPVIDWVKRNEKIELLTGIEDSPTLRSTAMAWRPSQKALAAALELRNNQEQTSNVSVESVLNGSADEDDDDDDVDAFIGLGFDPSNMDSVMSSPAVRAHATHLDTVDLTSLTLGVPSTDSKSEGKNIFAFDSSSTWGNTGGNKGAGDAFSTSSTPWGASSMRSHASSGDWGGVLGGSSTRGSVADTQDKAIAATSFLSLSSNNTWGSTGLFGSDHGTTAD